jgi:glyceraldehyde 3-phosphate dehydrogenase
MGINESDYDPVRHLVVSSASCTTTCLAFMLKPLMDSFGSKQILSVSMATVHASTPSQQVLDHLPKSGAQDLRKNRSIFNNIILTTTGAAETLGQVLPEMRQIPFIAESVRIPVNTGSLIILVVNFQEVVDKPLVDRGLVNNVYRDYAARDPNGYLLYTEEQNVSGDIIGLYRVAAIIEGHETHTRTANALFDLSQAIPAQFLEKLPETQLEIPVTQVVIYGWYDNELGSYSNLLGDRLVSMAEFML